MLKMKHDELRTAFSENAGQCIHGEFVLRAILTDYLDNEDINNVISLAKDNLNKILKANKPKFSFDLYYNPHYHLYITDNKIGILIVTPFCSTMLEINKTKNYIKKH